MTKRAAVKGMLNRLFGKGNNDRPKSFSARASILPNGKPNEIEMSIEEHQRLLDCLPDHPIDVGLGSEANDAISRYAEGDVANSKRISDSLLAYVHTKGSLGRDAEIDDALVMPKSRLKELLKANPAVNDIPVEDLGAFDRSRWDANFDGDRLYMPVEQLHIHEGKQPPDFDGDRIALKPLGHTLFQTIGIKGDSTIGDTLKPFGADFKPEHQELIILEGQSARTPFSPRREPYIKWNIDAKNGLSRKERRVLRRLSKKAGNRVLAAHFIYNTDYPRDPRSTHRAICLLPNGLRVLVNTVPYKTMMDYIDTYVPVYRPQTWSAEEYYHSLTKRGTI
jgi:hypothetical protein